MKWFRISLLSLVMFAPFWQQPSFAAKESVFIYASVDEEVAQQLVAAFEAETGIKVNFVRLSTGEAVARLEAEKANPQVSLWLGGVGLGHAEIKEKGLSIPYQSADTASLNPKFKDPEGYWNGIYLGVLSFVTNKELLKKKNLQPPQVWNDLLDPKWKGNIQIPNPGTSGTSYSLMIMLIAKSNEDKAFEYMKALNSNVSQYTRSGSAPAKNVALGETIIGIGYAQDILKLIHGSKSALELVYPKDGTGYEIAAMSLIKGGKQTETAKKLMEWCYSKKAAQILADNYIIPLKTKGVKLKEVAIYPKSLKLIDAPMEWAGKNKQRLIERWNDQINH